MDLHLDVTGLDLEAVGAREVEQLRVDVRDAVQEAAAEGVNEARTNHPYTDRTYHLSGDARATPVAGSRNEPYAEMYWPAKYASYVNEGTDDKNGIMRNKPYPFTPQAKQRAQAALERRLEQATEAFVGRMNRP